MARVTVPQPNGEIVVTRGGGEPLRFKVESGAVDVPDSQLASFLAAVEGSAIAPPPAAPAAKEK